MRNLEFWALGFAALLSILTFLVGVIAWTEFDPSVPWHQAAYSTFLAIGGSDIYHDIARAEDGTTLVTNALTTKLMVARWLGAAATLALVFAIFTLLGADLIRRRRIRRRKGHIVLVGVNQFSLSYVLALKGRFQGLTLVDTEDALNKHASGRLEQSILRAPIEFVQDSSLIHAVGRAPSKVIFADVSAPLNVERAQVLLNRRPDAPVQIRSEKQNVSADLDLWSPEFAKVPVISEVEFVARALVTEMAPLELARLRNQAFPHIAIIGVGDLALGIIEELALRCHAPGMWRLRISTFDKDRGLAAQKLKMERSGLRDAIDLVDVKSLDGATCGAPDDPVDPLFEAEQTAPLTAIIVCTGDDEINIDIALRLRRLQDEKGLYAAPILMRSRAAAAIAPDPITDVTSGLYRFGGPQVRKADIQLEQMQDRIGFVLHKIWQKETGRAAEKAWDNLDLALKRTNRRAALSAIEMFQTLGFVPPPGSPGADMRANPKLTNPVLGDTKLMQSLIRTEHKRWVAERKAEGWTQSRQTPPKRDDRRKIHDLMLPFDDLPMKERKKDKNNVRGILEESQRQFERMPNAASWRKRVRVGLMGPLEMQNPLPKEMVTEMRNWMRANGYSPRTHQLEIVTPNAPGFDRIAAIALLRDWWLWARRPADLLRYEADLEKYLDLNALEQIKLPDDKAQEAWLKDAQRQSQRLATEANGRNRRLGLRIGPVSQEDFSASEIEAVANGMHDMCELMIYLTYPGRNNFTRRHAKERKDSDNGFIWMRDNVECLRSKT